MMEAFGFIRPGHPFFPQIKRLRECITADALAPDEVRSLLRIDFAGQEPRLKWAYHCRQWKGPPFRATTCLYKDNRLKAKVFSFPDDPKLSAAAEFFSKNSDGQVLRYVPRRRLTVAIGDRIAKFVRPAELPDVLARLRLVEAQRKSAGFAIAQTTESNPQLGLFFQERLPGRPDFDALHEVGRVSRRIHQLDARNLPVGPNAFATVKRDVAMISLFQPSLRSWLTEAARDIPSFAPENVFCHGDLRAPHFLISGGQTAVIDFDGACAADSHWELALFITSLKRENPIFSDPGLHLAAEEEYLAGYESEGGRGNRDKLRWHRFAAEIHFLARTFQRDLYTPGLLQQSVEAIARLLGKGLP